jgi:RHS repeat-associated protein
LSTQLSTNNPQHYFYHADGSGNVLALVDAAGSVQARYSYEPFGRLFWQSGPLTNLNRLRFASKEMHLSSGLYDFGARWYDPFLQRWLTEDPLGEAGGMNLHQFVGNDPMNRVDPWGWEDVLLYAREPLTAAEVEALGLATVNGLDWLWDQTQALLAEDYGVGPDGQPMLGGTPPGGALLSKAGKGICKAARSAWGKMLQWAQARRAAKTPKPTWPSTAQQMDDFLKVPGKRIPDTPSTPGRGKVEWRPNADTKITFEQHPYHPSAPDWHKGPHFHLDTPGIKPHQRYVPGDPIPGYP